MIDHEAIKKAYPDAGIISDKGTFKEDGTEITIVQSQVDTARATIDAEYAALEYSRNRAAQYPSQAEQFDMQCIGIVLMVQPHGKMLLLK